MMKYAFELSEQVKLPVLLRVVTRLAHSRAGVEVSQPVEQNNLNPSDERTHWVLLPGNAKRQYAALVQKQDDLVLRSENSPYNQYPQLEKAETGVVACGIAYNYVMENDPSAPVLKISQYPVPEEKLREFAGKCSRILVAEDGQPFVENLVKGMLGSGYTVKGRLTGDLPRTGELTPDNVGAAMGTVVPKAFGKPENVMPRPPALCQGCGHRDVYDALNRILAEYKDARVFGDIGCYTLGALPPFRAIDSCVDMGASITMAKGAADAGVYPAVAVIGDSTFTHSGMTGLLDAVNDNANITVVISDNLTTAMTGGQDSAGTSKFEAICVALGVAPEHVRVVVPIARNMEEITGIIREELEYKGVSVIIPRRECIQTLNRKLRKKRAEQQ